MRRTPIIAAALCSVALASCAPPGAELAPDPEDVGQGEHALSVKPGDPVFRSGLTVIAPQAHEGIFAELLFDDGRTHTLNLRTDAAGNVFLLEDGVAIEEEVEHEYHAIHEDEDEEAALGEEAGVSTTKSATPPCSDKAHKLLPFKWTKRFDWYFRAGSTPSDADVTAVESRLKKAANNITRSRNTCDMADQVDATHSYKGRTTKAAQIGSDGSCTASGNGLNTVEFGTLPSSVLGIACVRYDTQGRAVEADVRLNKASAKWYGDKPSGCKGRFSVEAVATHEFGHVFGLGHVAESTSGNLTMSTQINGACQNAEATLGRGDVLALRKLY